MPDVVLEIHLDSGGGGWHHVGSMAAPDQSGSMSSLEPDGRQIYLFGWIDGQPGVWRSVGGIDIEYGPLRAVTSLDGLEQLADLTAGDYEATWISNTGPRHMRLRLA